MKKLLCILLCLMLVLPSALADTPARRLTEDDPAYVWLYEKSMELAAKVQNALHNPLYSVLFSLSEQVPKDEVSEELELLRMQDFANPTEVTIVRADQALANGTIAELFQYAADEGVLPEGQATEYLATLYHSTASMLSQNDSDALRLIAAWVESIVSKNYPLPDELDGPCFAVMYYGGLYVCLITFYPMDNGNVSARVQLIPSRAADALNIPVE